MLRQKLEPDVYLRVHLITSFSYDKQFILRHSVEEEIKLRENQLELNQMRKKNSFLDFLTNFTQDHAMPTKNVNLISVHEKNKGLMTRLEQLQASQKGIMMKNF